jgi:hypothetical protein
MDNQNIKSSLKQRVSEIAKLIASLKINVHLKLKILRFYLPSQISFQLRHYDLSVTWIENNLDSLIVNSVRDWLSMPVSTCVAEILSLPLSMGGLGIQSMKELYERNKLSVRSLFKSHPDPAMREMWSLSSKHHVNLDWRLANSNLKTAEDQLSKDYCERNLDHIKQLDIQGSSISQLTSSLGQKEFGRWHNVLSKLSDSLYKFVRKAIQNQLPTNNNLKRWGRSPTNLCPLCNNIQSNKHVLSNCSTPSVLQRYTLRHNAVLLILVEWLRSSIVDPAIKILADLDNSPSGEPTTVFNSFRPDIVIVGKNNKITSLELTICHESNFATSRARKVSKYSNLVSDLKREYSSFTLNQYFIEVSVVGFISDLSEFQKSVKIKPLPSSIKSDVSNMVIKLSQNIYWNRNIATA